MNFVLEMVVNLLAAESSVETKVTQHLGVLSIFLIFYGKQLFITEYIRSHHFFLA